MQIRGLEKNKSAGKSENCRNKRGDHCRIMTASAHKYPDYITENGKGGTQYCY